MVSPNENNRRTEAFRAIVATMPDPGTNTLVVTHKPHILRPVRQGLDEVKEGGIDLQTRWARHVRVDCTGADWPVVRREEVRPSRRGAKAKRSRLRARPRGVNGPGNAAMTQQDNKAREFFLGFIKIHILHHAAEEAVSRRIVRSGARKRPCLARDAAGAEARRGDAHEHRAPRGARTRASRTHGRRGLAHGGPVSTGMSGSWPHSNQPGS